MKIEVTQQDIDAGERGKCDRCPVALAINRAIAGLKLGTCEVGDDEAIIAGRRYHNPESVGRFIRAFDRGDYDGCAPFTFELPDKPRDWHLG